MRYGILGEHAPGGLAEYVAVRGDNVLPLPDSVSFEAAASFVLTNMTAWRMVVTQGQVRPGQDVLVIGVGGGVSSTAVQIARLCAPASRHLSGGRRWEAKALGPRWDHYKKIPTGPAVFQATASAGWTSSSDVARRPEDPSARQGRGRLSPALDLVPVGDTLIPWCLEAVAPRF